MAITYNDAPFAARKPRPGILGAIGNMISLLTSSIAAANTFENLNQLSDTQLARRGLVRADIAYVAMKVLVDES